MSRWTGRRQHHLDRDLMVPNEFLIKRLKELKLSCRELAKRIGMSEIDLSYLKQGRMVPSYTEAEMMARELNCTPEEIFPEFTNMPEVLKKFVNLPDGPKSQTRHVLDEKLKFMKEKGQA